MGPAKPKNGAQQLPCVFVNLSRPRQTRTHKFVSSKDRRGNLTANEVWGNKTSVLVGDFLFSRSFQLMTKYGTLETLKILSDTSVVISEGEVLEISNDKNLEMNDDLVENLQTF